MYAIKQLFLILSILSVASAKKGTSIRATPGENLNARRGLKKSKKGGGGYVAPNRGGGVGTPGTINGLNRDGSTPGELIEPEGKDCVPFDEASRWITEDYPGDPECRTEGAITLSSACCRVFSFTDTSGPQKWLLYDANNQYRDLMCVCNDFTRSGNGATGEVIPVPAPAIVSQPVDLVAPAPAPVTAPVAAPVASTGGPVCSNPNPTQLDLQSRPGVTACVTNTECGGDDAAKCCSVDTCICYPKNFLEPSKCIPAA